MARIAIGGWQHETNTFAPHKADFKAFERADDWPHLSRGADVFDAIDGVHLPITGAVETLRSSGHELLPLLWAAATPSGPVTEDAYERISELILKSLMEILPVDGVFLDLHGAMVAEHMDDGEGTLLHRIRNVIGPDVPIAVSLDLHANVSDAMLEFADVLDTFRSYPHVDMGETGSRTARHLNEIIQSGKRWYCALRRPSFLIPISSGCTVFDPARSLYARIPELVQGEVTALSLACGFPLADIVDAGPAVIAYGLSQDAADSAADTMTAEVEQRKTEFGGKVFSPTAAVTEAQRLAACRTGPVVLADSQDNPGGGGPGDTTGLLRALVAGRAERAIVASIADPEVALQAHRAGEGGTIDAKLGEKSGLPGHEPYVARFKVIKLSDGCFAATGPMYQGAQIQLGKTALLQTAGIGIIVGSQAVQVADQSFLRHIGIEPAEQSIIAVKSSVHFRNDFQSVASTILVVAAPGPVYADLNALGFEKSVRAPVRIRMEPTSGESAADQTC